MEIFSSESMPAPRTSPLGAHWLNSPPHASDGCPRCLRMGRAGGQKTHVTAATGSPARRTAPQTSPKSAASRLAVLAVPARMVIVAVAVCTVLSAMLAVALT
ncbi:hypothetical protein [Streptomyces flavidovirens]|uniref:hypothetical protein n=1 Tax=Streptomyces flavidovirens TaxID=67298 RepID=UPI0004916884|nr:hypothetical protein [Streptomyces flavidovirens]